MGRILLAVFFSSLLVGTNAHALSLTVDSSGILTGATGVLVSGSSYNVEFIEGTCATVFGSCTQSNFAFTTEASAIAASNALLTAVLIDGLGIGNAFDSNPALTNGCSWPSNCWIMTPYEVSGAEMFLAQALNQVNDSSDGSFLRGYSNSIPMSYNSSSDINGTFARWSSVPEPSTIMLLILGMTVLFIPSLRHPLRRDF